MTTVELLSSLRQLNVKLWVEGERLRYSAPPKALSPDLLAQLASRKAEIINLLSQARSDPAAAPPIAPVNRDQILPLSYAQQRLWILDRLSTDGSAYHIPVVLRLQGSLDVEALRRSINEIVKRHEALRTIFTVVDGEPQQTILPELEIVIPLVDVSNLVAGEREAELERIAAENSHQSFDLSRGPMLRAVIVKLDDGDHALCLTLHHIISDGWSSGVLVQELASLYEAFAAGRTPALPPLKVQYADFAIWQREWLKGNVKEQHLSYWRKQLGENVPVLELPTVKPRPVVQTLRGATQSLQLSRPLTDSINELSRQQNATLFMVLLGAFQVLLSRYTRQEEIVVGTPIANRNRAEIEPLIGFFVNTLVLRADLSDDPSFSWLLRRVRDASLEAYAHQDLPFEVLVDELQPRRDVNRTPLFQVMFVLQNAPFDSLRLPRLTISLLLLENRTAKFDLTLSARESENGIGLALEYNTDIFDSAYIKRMLEQYEILLEGVVQNPDLPVSRLPLLSESEKQELLKVSQGVSHYPAATTLHELFEACALATPEATAIVCEGRRLSYRDLDQQANRIANRLRRLGVGPESLVSVCLERSEALVVAILGVLKAGAAYVPLDPASPPERLAFLMEDSRSPVLITMQPLLDRLTGHSAHVLLLDADRQNLAEESVERPIVETSPDNLAYVIYTSGSMGKPKGTLVTHYNVTRLFEATNSWFNFNEHDVWTLFHSYAFDFSVWEIWGALLYGGRLVVVPYTVSRSPAAFYELLTTEQVTVLNQTPSAFRQLIQAEEELGISPELSLRLIIFGGEALELQSLKPWFDRHGDTRPQLVNMYGITETTVHVTYRPLTATDLTTAPGSVIGRPIPDLQVYILDKHMQPVPLGVPGEMFVGGAGVARGYLNRPDLSAQRYVPDPFSRTPGQRLYRTGDLARSLPGGDVEYLGRLDQQVKIRGHRIELGEIEATLNQRPEIRESVVVAKEDAATKISRLVAYVIPVQSTALAVDEMRRWLKRTLPDYMIPAAFVTLQSLPLTGNGKVDYRALPDADSARPELGDGYVAPRTESEKVLAEVWAEVLGVERVGVNDNFFDLGGDSILSIRVNAKAGQRGLTFPLQEIFRCQTVAELAAISETNGTKTSPEQSKAFSLLSETDAARIPADAEDAYPLAMLQTGMIFHSEYSSSSTAYLNVSSVHLRTIFDREALQAALKKLTERHPILRASFDLTAFSEPLQLIHREAEIDLQVDDLRALPVAEQEEVIARWVEAEQSHEFDLSRAPLLRFHAHLRSDETFQLSWTEHHAILDGWSLASMLTELFQFYFSFLGEDIAPVPSPPQATFRDFVARERETLASEEAQRYWENTLSERNVLTLPRRATSDSESTAQQLKQAFTITPELSASLKRLASSAGVPLKTVLLAAHLKVLSVLGNQRDVLAGLVSNGRLEETDGERVLGLFLNTVPFRSVLQRGSWLDLIRETFRIEQELLPFRRYPVAELQRQYGGGVPLFETMFNFTHFHVYQGLGQISALEVLDIQSIAVTNYTLAADFNLDLVTNNVQMRLEYNTAKLSAADIETIGGYYLNAFEAIVSEPAADYLSHSLLAAAELAQLREMSAGVIRDDASGETLHGLFEEQVMRTPSAEALCSGDESLTYEELNRRANALAARLQRMGVGPESRAGVLMSRSTDLVVALLGVLKTGGCYVPLDPAYPSERLNYIMNDGQISVLLTEGSLADHLHDCAAQVVFLDRANEDTDGERMQTPVAANNLAYVIYTSGSTGQPKGVAIEHRSAAVMVRWAQEVFSDDLLRGMLFSTSVCFDLSIFELFVPLSCGGRVIIAENALQLPELPKAHEVTLVNTVPSAMTELLRIGNLPESIRAVNLAGEALKEELVDHVYASTNAEVVYNLYGPSEDTTYSTYALVRSGRRVTIGRPIANTNVYVLNELLQMVPAGVAGEIYIGGDGLARGYLNRPALTAEKFIPNPFSDKPGGRLYRTGDLGRYLPDGEIEFLSRLDYQVKIRGFRIEIGEIESVLLQHPEVRESVVLAREDVPGDKRLVAYVVADSANAPSAAALREHLKKKLPDYMIPSAFVTLESMPLTPNGKVNRKALPAPESSGIELSDTYIGPRDSLEMRLVQVWENTLGVPSVGVKDNFFDLGGNSLLAVRLMAQIRKEFGEHVPINALFHGATVEDLAQVLRRQSLRQTGQQTYSQAESVVGIQTSGSRAPLFCVHPIGGSVFCYRELSRGLGHDQPLYGLQAPGLYGEREPFGSIEDLASHYLKAVREVQPGGPYHLGGWSMGGVVAFEMARQLREQGEEVAFLGLIDSAVPKPLEQFDEASILAGFLRDLGAQVSKSSGKSLPDLSERLRELDSHAQVACLLEEAVANGLLPPQTDAAQIESLLRVFKRNVQALSSYVPQRYAGRLALFRAVGNNGHDAVSAWSNFATAVEVYSIPGSHYTVMTQPSVNALATFVNSELATTIKQGMPQNSTKDANEVALHSAFTTVHD